MSEHTDKYWSTENMSAFKKDFIKKQLRGYKFFNVFESIRGQILIMA